MTSRDLTGRIRKATDDDAAEIARIYAPYVRHSPTSFELEPPSAAEMQRRIRQSHAHSGWYVYEIDGRVVGYAYGSKHRSREAYQWAAEVSVYVDVEFQRRGIARRLYTHLLTELEALGFHQALAGITLPNEASVGFHEAMGFLPIGIYRQVGYKLGKWHDVGWWQKPIQAWDQTPQPLASPTVLTRGEFTLSWDPSHLQREAIYGFLGQTHWAAKRRQDLIDKSLDHSLCYGVFHKGRQVAFARVVTDYSTFAYLCDVFVEEGFRGQGLSKWMIEAIVAHPELKTLRRFVLATKDAHSLYLQYGFQPLSADEKERFMQILNNDV